MFNFFRINKPKFTIEHYPKTKRYYPKYGEYYIQLDWNTGIYELQKPWGFMYADYGDSEKEARKIIELYKEQRLKENMKIINVD